MHYFHDCSYMYNTMMFSTQNSLSTSVEKCVKHCIPNQCMKVAKKMIWLFVKKLAKGFATNKYQVMNNILYLQLVISSGTISGILFHKYVQICKLPLFSYSYIFNIYNYIFVFVSSDAYYLFVVIMNITMIYVYIFLL